jgi:hypothetical protein
MTRPDLTNSNRSALSLGLFALLSTVLTGRLSTAEQQQAYLRQDSGTCASFGGTYGFPAHSQCMLAQQQPRDAQLIQSMEMARISSEIARNNQEAADLRDRD